MSDEAIELCSSYLCELDKSITAPKTRKKMVKKIKKMGIEAAVEFFGNWEYFVTEFRRRMTRGFETRQQGIDLIFFVLRKLAYFQIPVPKPCEELGSLIAKSVPF